MLEFNFLEIVKLNLSPTEPNYEFDRLFTQYMSELNQEVKHSVSLALAQTPFMQPFLLIQNTEAKGFAILQEQFSTYQMSRFINLHDFYICTSVRGQGLARRFLVQLNELYQAEGYLKMTLEVNGKNEKAKALYESLGFELEVVKAPDLLRMQKYY